MGHSIICKEDKLDEMTWALETTHLIYDGNISIMREQAGHSRHLWIKAFILNNQLFFFGSFSIYMGPEKLCYVDTISHQ